jgi:exopolysaccharide biosynthesis predicted pyruvyltransferase EpsI
MKRVGIITINDYNNYGNRLQNYAMHEVLKSLGCEVQTIRNTPLKHNNTYRKDVYYVINRIKEMSSTELIEAILKRTVYRFHVTKNKKIINKRIEAFKKFTYKNIKETSYLVNVDTIPFDLEKQFDYFIIGSDQVWNPVFRHGYSLDFCTFAPIYKRIAYAPSFGISTIPDKYKEKYKNWLYEIEHLSVREEAGAQIIKELTGKETPVLIDPTLILTREEWNSIAIKANNKPAGNYILTYFLGGVTKENKNRIRYIAKNKGFEIVNLACLKDRKRYNADPSEFIDYVASASVLFTDSFHGAIYSIIFEKPFVVFDRIGKIPTMGSRIDTLLSKFKLEDRKWNNIKNTNAIFNVDFSHIPPILDSERKKALNYLKNALDIKDGD